jgi:hypothetical protein
MIQMTASFRYDIAISSVSFDALTASRLVERLRVRLPLAVFSSWEHQRGGQSVDGAAVTSRVLRHESRIVAVLHQRLWGETPSTRADSSALARRVEAEGCGFLRMISLEHAEPQPWMPPRQGWDDLAVDGIDATSERIVATVLDAGGYARVESRSEAMPRVSRELETQQERDSFLHSGRAVAASAHEFDHIVKEIDQRLAKIRICAPEISIELRRSPDRCIVQAGRVGFSLSWLRSGGDVADASLLVIEWEGTISFPGDSRRTTARATAVRELQLHADATGPAAWHWSVGGPDGRAYTSSDLAAQCVALLMRELGITAAH